MRPSAPFLSPLLALCLIAACGVEKADSGSLSASGTPPAPAVLSVEWRSEPTPLPINEPFELYVRALDNTGAVPPGASLTVEGWMPDHGHGMLRQPVATLQPDGWFHVEGMLFHMAGDWELRIRVGWRAYNAEHFSIQSQLATFEVHL